MPEYKKLENQTSITGSPLHVGARQADSAREPEPVSSGTNESWQYIPEKLVPSSLQERGLRDAISQVKSLRVVVVTLQGHEQAIEVDLVEEIIKSPHVSPLIKAPFFVEGVMRLRGKIVPVVDLKKAIKLVGEFKTAKEPVVVLVRIWGKRIGFKVDSVLELVTIPVSSIEPPKSILGGVDSRFMKGLTYLEDRLLAILDLEAMLSENQEMILRDDDSLGLAEELNKHEESVDKLTTRRIISFVLDTEIFGADMGSVAEIMEMTEIMPVPNVPEFVSGLINLRGDIVPVIDLRTLFRLERKSWTNNSRIVIMKEKGLLVGIVVDSMWESLRLAPADFQPAPHNDSKINSQFFKDISVVSGRVVSVLDIARILSETSGKSYSDYHSQDLLAARSIPRSDSSSRGTE